MTNLADSRSDLLHLLAEDHQVVTTMIRRLKTLPVSEERDALFAELEERWLAHADAEDALVLAPLAERAASAGVVAAVRACHAAIERVLDHLGAHVLDDGAWREGIDLLECLIGDHVRTAEERLFDHAGSALDPAARRVLASSYHAALRDLAA
jgi:hypothetical protein